MSEKRKGPLHIVSEGLATGTRTSPVCPGRLGAKHGRNSGRLAAHGSLSRLGPAMVGDMKGNSQRDCYGHRSATHWAEEDS